MVDLGSAHINPVSVLLHRNDDVLLQALDHVRPRRRPHRKLQLAPARLLKTDEGTTSVKTTMSLGSLSLLLVFGSVGAVGEGAICRDGVKVPCDLPEVQARVLQGLLLFSPFAFRPQGFPWCCQGGQTQ